MRPSRQCVQPSWCICREFSSCKWHQDGEKTAYHQGRKNSININFFWPGFPADIPDPYTRMPRGQKASPHHQGRRKTHFLVRTSTMFGADVHDPKGCWKTLYKIGLRWFFGPYTILFNQGRKRNPNPNFLVRIPSGRVGVFHVKGWGPKSSVCHSKPRETKLFGGISRDFCRDIPGCLKSLRKKSLCSILVPIFKIITRMKLLCSNYFREL